MGGPHHMIDFWACPSVWCAGNCCFQHVSQTTYNRARLDGDRYIMRVAEMTVMREFVTGARRLVLVQGPRRRSNLEQSLLDEVQALSEGKQFMDANLYFGDDLFSGGGRRARAREGA